MAGVNGGIYDVLVLASIVTAHRQHSMHSAAYFHNICFHIILCIPSRLCILKIDMYLSRYTYKTYYTICLLDLVFRLSWKVNNLQLGNHFLPSIFELQNWFCSPGTRSVLPQSREYGKWVFKWVLKGLEAQNSPGTRVNFMAKALILRETVEF